MNEKSQLLIELVNNTLVKQNNKTVSAYVSVKS